MGVFTRIVYSEETPDPWYENLVIGGDTISVEIAATEEERNQGLSDRMGLRENSGMLFVFPDEAPRTFWMYHCHFHIDLAYLDSSGVIVEIITMLREPYQTPPEKLKRYFSKSGKIKYALEMSYKWFEKNRIKPGTKLDLERF